MSRFNFFTALALLTDLGNALLRFPCSQSSVQRLDPLVQPGSNPSSHLHQIVGGNSFNVSMDIATHDLPTLSTCTSCSFSQNYWTAVLFYRAKNGTFKRVPQKAQDNSQNNGGMMVYYMSDALFDTQQALNVTAFKPGFRILVGHVTFNTRDQARQYRQLTYTCMQDASTRAPETINFPTTPCPFGLMANHRFHVAQRYVLLFPTCWDRVNLDSLNHQDHAAYPESGTFESRGPCPSTHPVRLPQILLETVWDTSQFNNIDPLDFANGTQPFVWSSGDATGFFDHADYVFGWKDNALQQAMDGHTYVTAPMLTTQSVQLQNQCTVKDMVGEAIDGWLDELPGLNPVTM
ncbi:hypothetical protein F5Y16DRAFT_412910 [Xylariaceae sp. FL0255]|nr:hypothetical protein F5Y16DRAFT_412910 [Xylariaceae sp. FL0255]